MNFQQTHPGYMLPQRANSIVVLDDRDHGSENDSGNGSDSSGTIDNDPDTRYFLDADVTGGQRVSTPAPLSNLDATRPSEVIDLTAGAPSCFNEGDYLTDESFQTLIRDWQAPEVARAPGEEQHPERRAIPEACIDGILYRPGQSVELFDETFLRIETVMEDGEGSVFLHGRRLVRAVLHPGTYIPRWRNEVIWSDNDQTDIPLEIVRRFVPVVLTNWYQPERGYYASRLYCRLKETKDSAVEYLSPEDADEGHRFHPKVMRQDWRGPTRLFGEADAQQDRAIDLEDSPVVDLTEPEIVHRYAFGDGFCGAGGVSAGASQAGMSIKWAFDNSHHATATYRLNYDTAICEQSDVFSFLTNDSTFLRVDVSHGSPPCQTFSPAHTVECANDDANSACIFSCADLIRKAKPRVHTMEETCGLFERHKEVFFRVIQDFLELGYSVRWGILNCMDYGVPQSRRRLIIIASGYVSLNLLALCIN